eukprot:scaffold8574_cov103-Isochrysis_galbana.AAC.1
MCSLWDSGARTKASAVPCATKQYLAIESRRRKVIPEGEVRSPPAPPHSPPKHRKRWAHCSPANDSTTQSGGVKVAGWGGTTSRMQPSQSVSAGEALAHRASASERGIIIAGPPDHAPKRKPDGSEKKPDGSAVRGRPVPGAAAAGACAAGVPAGGVWIGCWSGGARTPSAPKLPPGSGSVGQPMAARLGIPPEMRPSPMA